MSFDSTGLTPKTQQEILVELNSEVVQNVKTFTGDSEATVDTSIDSPIGRLNNIFAKHLANIWEQANLVEDSMRADKAVGVSLEKLALLVGFTRKPASFTQGDLRFVGDNGTIVPEGSIFATLQEDNFNNTSDVLITLDTCYSCEVKVGSIVATSDYSIQIGGEIYTFTSDSDPTVTEILQGLEALINADNEVTATFVLDVDNEEDSILSLVKDDQSLTMAVTLSPLLISQNVEVEGVVRASETGIIFGDANTLINIVTSQSGLERVYNPADFIIGTVKEVDADLRERVTTDFNTVGSGTPDTIEAVFDRNALVRDVLVEENRTFETNVNGIPAKSYEVILNHEGTSQQMADIVWQTKPAGIATHGDITETVQDARGEDKQVKFSLATDLFAYVKVRGTELDPAEGENLPSNYADIIAQAITVEGNTFEIDEDVIAKRFYGIIYNNVEGIDDLTVEVYLDANPNLDVLTIPAGNFQDVWPIGRKEISSFATDRFDIDITAF